MKVETIQDLKKVIDLCRKSGVDIIKVDGIEMVLGTKPETVQRVKPVQPSTTQTYAPGGITEELRIPTDDLTEEQLLFGSSDPSVWETGKEQ